MRKGNKTRKIRKKNTKIEKTENTKIMKKKTCSRK
jgi:hypothetical protein